MNFEKKKIQVETLSEYLLGARTQLNLSLNEVSIHTGIKPKFLSALENGDFAKLPADVYVMGFLVQLARMYSVDAEELIHQYKKEKGIHKNLSKAGRLFSSNSSFRQMFARLIITPKILSMAAGVAFVSITFGYIVWQVWSINKMPSLKIVSPENFSVIAGASVDVLGQTDPGMSVAINGQNVFVDSQGHFRTQLGLSSGPKQVNIEAKNRFGKSVSKTLTVTASAQAKESAIVPVLRLALSFTEPVRLGLIIDDQPQQDLTFNAGEARVFNGHNKILLSTSNAGATVINLNGEDLGPMGKPNEELSNVPFLASFGE